MSYQKGQIQIQIDNKTCFYMLVSNTFVEKRKKIIELVRGSEK